jgi:hypothetical protein
VIITVTQVINKVTQVINKVTQVINKVTQVIIKVTQVIITVTQVINKVTQVINKGRPFHSGTRDLGAPRRPASSADRAPPCPGGPHASPRLGVRPPARSTATKACCS